VADGLEELGSFTRRLVQEGGRVFMDDSENDLDEKHQTRQVIA
jgi:hypothetical protein